MSFTETGATTTITANDNNSVAGTNTVAATPFSLSASYLITVNSGTTTFTAEYKSTAGTSTFLASSIIAQIF